MHLFPITRSHAYLHTSARHAKKKSIDGIEMWFRTNMHGYQSIFSIISIDRDSFICHNCFSISLSLLMVASVLSQISAFNHFQTYTKTLYTRYVQCCQALNLMRQRQDARRCFRQLFLLILHYFLWQRQLFNQISIRFQIHTIFGSLTAPFACVQL